jgi:hypothetical protein
MVNLIGPIILIYYDAWSTKHYTNTMYLLFNSQLITLNCNAYPGTFVTKYFNCRFLA